MLLIVQSHAHQTTSVPLAKSVQLPVPLDIVTTLVPQFVVRTYILLLLFYIIPIYGYVTMKIYH